MTDWLSSGHSAALIVVGIFMSVLAIGWAVFRIRTGIKVRELAGNGILDTRDLGVGARFYAPILALAVLVAGLAWLSVRSEGLVSLLCVLGILLSAVGIGRLRIAGYRSRQSTHIEALQ
ncbi:MAG: hypothetical protein WAS05_04655 [Candidatus Nanopelagicales bacterium]